MLVKLMSVIALGATTVFAASATPTIKARDVEFNPPPSVLGARSYESRSQVSARELTNGKRLAAGLPLNPPHRRSHTGVSRSVPSGTPPITGYLEAKDQNGECVGYVRKTFNSFGEYGLTEDENERLLMSINLSDATSGAADIQTKDGPDVDYPFFGGITGFSSDSSNIKPGSANYVYLGGVKQTSPNAPASELGNSFTARTRISEKVESAIFTYKGLLGLMDPQWINEDSSRPTTYVGYTQGVLILTGDKTAFVNTFGPTIWVTLYFSRY